MYKDRNGLLNTIDGRLRDKLMARGFVTFMKKGRPLFKERQKVDAVYFILKGYVELSRMNHTGTRRVIFICASGECVNEVVFEQPIASVTATALGDVMLLKLHRRDFMVLCDEEPGLVRAIFNSCALKNRRLYHQLSNITAANRLDKQLEGKLWKLARDFGVDTPEGRRIDIEMSVNFISDLIAAKRETTSRILKKLREDGLICQQGGYITIPDMERLRTDIFGSGH